MSKDKTKVNILFSQRSIYFCAVPSFKGGIQKADLKKLPDAITWFSAYRVNKDSPPLGAYSSSGYTMQTPDNKSFVRGRGKSESSCMAKIYITNSLPKVNLQYAKECFCLKVARICFNSYSELNECIYRVVKYSLHVIKNTTERHLLTIEPKQYLLH